MLRKRVAHRTKKYLRMADRIRRLVDNRRIPVRFVARRTVKNAFAGHDRNKHEIACMLAVRFPELAPKLPPKRKCWQSDAAALGVAYFSRYAKVCPRQFGREPCIFTTCPSRTVPTAPFFISSITGGVTGKADSLQRGRRKGLPLRLGIFSTSSLKTPKGGKSDGVGKYHRAHREG